MKKIYTLISIFLVVCLLFCSCGSKPTSAATNSVILSSVMDKIRTEVELPEMLDLTADNLTDLFGIEQDEYTDFAACINANGFEKEEVILILAADSSAVESIATKLNDARESAAAEMQNYIPEQYDLVMESQVSTNGLYVSLIISENNAQINQIFLNSIG